VDRFTSNQDQNDYWPISLKSLIHFTSENAVMCNYTGGSHNCSGLST